MSTFRRRAARFLAAGVVAAGVMLPTAAFAGSDPTDPSYPTPSDPPQVSSNTGDPGGAAVSSQGSDPGSSLPVTGGQIAGLTLIGFGVTGAGIVLARLGRRPTRPRLTL